MAGNTTTGQISTTRSNFLIRKMLERAYPYFVHGLFAQVNDLPKNSGTAVRFRKYGSLSAATTALSEGVTPEATQLSYTDINATPLQYGSYTISTDYLKMTVEEDYPSENAAILGDQFGDTIDQLIRDVLAAGDTIQYASTATQRTEVIAGMILTGDEVSEAQLTLENANAKPITEVVVPSDAFNTTPVEASFVAIASPATIRDLRDKCPDWKPVETYAPNKSDRIHPAEKGAVHDVRFISTSSAKTFASTVTVHATIILGMNAYGITRIVGEEMNMYYTPPGGLTDPLHQRSALGWKTAFVAKRLQEAFMIRVEHAVS
jgi:N4-gp56 family major capsid protein